MRHKKRKIAIISILVIVVVMSLVYLFRNKTELINTPIYILKDQEQPSVNIYRMDEAEEENLPEGWLEVEIKSEEDIEELIKLVESYQKQKQEVSIRVKDRIASVNGQDVVKTLDLIEAFYYNISIRYPSVKEVVVMGQLEQLDSRIQDKYNKIQIKPYIKVERENAISQENFTFVVDIEPIKGQYVEYKINEEVVGKSTRYPYVFETNQAMFHEGINEIRVSVYKPEEETADTEVFYIDFTGQVTYAQRAPRKAEVYGKEQVPIYDTGYIPVLMYHKFLDEVGPDQQSIAVSNQLFEEQLKRLIAEGYTGINFKQLEDYLLGEQGLPDKPIIITADDGYLCNYEDAYAILQKYEMPATFFVATQHMGSLSYNDHFDWEEAREMEESGLIDIQSHTHSHIPMKAHDELRAKYEMDQSFDLIQKHLGTRDVEVLAYPQFEHTAKLQEWVKESGIDLQVTDLIRRRHIATSQMEIKRIHVSNETTADELIDRIEKATQK